MSVLVRKRKLSELKFYDNAIRLRRSMIYLLMRDLGAKRGVRDIQWMAKDLPPHPARYRHHRAPETESARETRGSGENGLRRLRTAVSVVARRQRMV